MKRAGVLGIFPLLFLLSCQTNGGGTETADQTETRTSIRDYVCRVDVNYHPEMNEYLMAQVAANLGEGTAEADNRAAYYSRLRKREGGMGSGFVYVDGQGNNYIITNYHVIAQAYTYTVTFEDSDNVIRERYTNLRVFSADIENDLAILEFPEGLRPFKRGLALSGKEPADLDVVITAGYPGIGNQFITQWRSAEGKITSAKHEVNKQLFILHNANTDGGNSGGPLLVADADSPIGYSVLGVVNAKYPDVQGGNLAIPASRVRQFVDKAFADRKLSPREQLDPRAAAFITELNGDLDLSKSVNFISPAMLADNPNWTIEDCTSQLGNLGLIAPYFLQLRNDVEKLIEQDPIGGIELATALSKIYLPVALARMRDDSGQAIQVFEPEENNFGGYTVWINVCGTPYQSEWIKSNGTWCINSFQMDDGEFNNVPQFAARHPLGLYVNYQFSSSRDVDCYQIDVEKAGNIIIQTASMADTVIEVYVDEKKIPGGNLRTGRNNDGLIGKELTIAVPEGNCLIALAPNNRGITDVPYSLFVRQE